MMAHENDAKVRIQYINRGITFEVIGRYRRCGAEQIFTTVGGFRIPNEKILHWEYVKYNNKEISK